jgi:hypothetical protein
MIYYLPASEHKMLNSTLARPLRQGPYRTASEGEFSDLTNFIHSTGYPILHVGRRFSSPTVER